MPDFSQLRSRQDDKLPDTRRSSERRIWRRWRAAERLEGFLEQLTDQAAAAGRSLEEPDDEWPLTLVLLPAEENLQVVSISRSYLVDDAGKAALSQMMAQLAWEHCAVALAFVSHGSFEEQSGESDGARREVLLIEEARAEGVRLHAARVNRFEDQPPALGDWQQITGPANGLRARFVEESREVLKANHSRFVS